MGPSPDNPDEYLIVRGGYADCAIEHPPQLLLSFLRASYFRAALMHRYEGRVLTVEAFDRADDFLAKQGERPASGPDAHPSSSRRSKEMLAALPPGITRLPEGPKAWFDRAARKVKSGKVFKSRQ
ncbi:MAG: hypothetical protein AAF928_02225 [Myxococcota bacterium]